MHKIMASPEVIDGGRRRPEDMYSLSKTAHCCGHVEWVHCLYAHTHTSQRPIAHSHSKDYISLTLKTLPPSLLAVCTQHAKLWSCWLVNIQWTGGCVCVCLTFLWPLLLNQYLCPLNFSQSHADFTESVHIFVTLMCYPVAAFQSTSWDVHIFFHLNVLRSKKKGNSFKGRSSRHWGPRGHFWVTLVSAKTASLFKVFSFPPPAECSIA